MAIDEKAFGSIKGLSTQPATMRQIIEAYEAAKVADQPDDCRAAFVKWCWPELSGPDDVALITIFDGESYIEPFGTAWKAWQACWHSRPVRESVKLDQCEKALFYLKYSHGCWCQIKPKEGHLHSTGCEWAQAATQIEGGN